MLPFSSGLAGALPGGRGASADDGGLREVLVATRGMRLVRSGVLWCSSSLIGCSRGVGHHIGSLLAVSTPVFCSYRVDLSGKF